MTVKEMNGEPLEPRDLLPAWELLAMLAEECCELGQAALKLRRVLDDVNPTRISYTEAITNLNEEWADVLLTIRQLSVIDLEKVLIFMHKKNERWVNHLIEHRKEEESGEKNDL